MFLRRDDITLAGGGSILGGAHGDLLSVTSHHSLWFKPNPTTKKSRGATGNSGNADKDGMQPVSETAEPQAGSVVPNVAVWATSKRTSANSKVLRNQSVDPVDMRHGSASIASVANVACPSPGDTRLAETAETARTSRTSIEWASERARSFSRQPPQTAETGVYLYGYFLPSSRAEPPKGRRSRGTCSC